jgi:hypothetical protein
MEPGTGGVIPPIHPNSLITIQLTEPPIQYLGILGAPTPDSTESAIFLDYDLGIPDTSKLPGNWILIKSSPGHYHLVIPEMFPASIIWAWIKECAPSRYSIAYLGRSYRPYEDGETQAPQFCIRVSEKNGHLPQIVSSYLNRTHWQELTDTLYDTLNHGPGPGTRPRGLKHGPVSFVQYQRARSIALIGGIL